MEYDHNAMARLQELPPDPPQPPPRPPAPPSDDWDLVAFLTSQRHFTAVASLLLLSELALSLAIIRFVPLEDEPIPVAESDRAVDESCSDLDSPKNSRTITDANPKDTEIDWTTYNEQVRLFLSGERDYALIKGSTGPLVYPAGFLYVYSVLHWMTDGGRDIRVAQYVFAQLYLVTLALVFVIFKRCGTVPPYMLVLMTLSKRLHSIYMLRLFNDGVGMLFLYLAVLAWTAPRPKWSLGSIFFSLALSIKMNFLLYVPAVLYLLVTTVGLLPTLLQLALIGLLQLLLALPFLTTSAHTSSYLQGAFNFSRIFEWEWTVNWRWLGQEAFENPNVGRTLLALNAVVVGLCVVNWAGLEGGFWKIARRGLRNPTRPAGFVRSNPDRVVTLLFTSNLVGILFARSLHYQFYAWYAHQVVFLLVHTPYDVLQQLGFWLAIEYGWSTFPSTINSSLGLTGANAIVLVGVWFGFPVGAGGGAGMAKTE